MPTKLQIIAKNVKPAAIGATTIIFASLSLTLELMDQSEFASSRDDGLKFIDTSEQPELPVESVLQYPKTPNLYLESSARERLGTTGLVIVAMRKNAIAITSNGSAAEFEKSFMFVCMYALLLYFFCST